MNLTTEPTSNFTTLLNVSFKPPPLIYVNDHVAQTLLPVTVVLWFYIAIGVLGNSLVMFVYWARKKPVREDRYFIPLLALVDLLSCVVSSGTGIYAQTYPLIFDNDFGCKMAAFLGILFAGLSANFLVIIAVERYLKVCKPFRRQMTILTKKIAFIVMIAISLVCSIPSLGIYRVEEVPMKMKGGFKIQTWKCIDTKDKEHATGHMIYKIALFVITMIKFVVLVVCYSNISFIIFKQRKYRHRMGSITSNGSTSVSCSHKDEEVQLKTPAVKEEFEHVKVVTKKEFERKIQHPLVGNKTHKRKVTDPERCNRKQSVVSATGSLRRKGSVVDRQGIRLTLIFILVTIIYIITYGPKVWLMLEQTVNRHFWSSIPPSQLVFYRFLHTFYIFNNIVNPIVYGIMDRRFRSDLRSCFKICE
ncbi:P2Y purinoceptor 12-like [Ylistrum balloti]|uniref:P2Y purinoceptor 12-like n=1 Tax=Ylistrum balloti TaxID=509963 RepID=UPI0029059ED7|nr:P2Y purinoceptor 12-like [Ylistrum balloti]